MRSTGVGAFTDAGKYGCSITCHSQIVSRGCCKRKWLCNAASSAIFLIGNTIAFNRNRGIFKWLRERVRRGSLSRL